MLNYLWDLYKKIILYLKGYIIFSSVWKNNPYLDLTIKFLLIIWQKTKLLKKNLKQFKFFVKNLNLLQYIIFIYFFFLGIIPLIIIIIFWLFFFYLIIYLFLLIIDIFIFKFLLIYTNNKSNIMKNYIIYHKIQLNINNIFNKIYYLLLNILFIFIEILTINWWYMNIRKFLIKPIDKLLCWMLDKFFNIFSNILKGSKILFLKIYTFILILKDNWSISYKPNIKKIIISIKLLKYYRINWKIYFTHLVKYIILIKYFIKIIYNKWFWLYYFNFYFLDIFIFKYYIKVKYVYINFSYNMRNKILKLYYNYKKNYINIYYNTIFIYIIKFTLIYYSMLIKFVFNIFKPLRYLLNNYLLFNYRIRNIIKLNIFNYYIKNLISRVILTIKLNNLKTILIYFSYKYINIVFKLSNIFIIIYLLNIL